MKVSWMNQIQNQLYRDYPLPDKTATFSTVKGTDTYDFPADCPEDRVQLLNVGGRDYVYSTIFDADDAFVYYWRAIAGKIVLYPIPDQIQSATLYYGPRPVTLTEADLTAIPSFPLDFHELLMVGCAARVAKAVGNLQLASIYEGDYRMLIEKADLVLVKSRQQSVRLVRTWM